MKNLSDRWLQSSVQWDKLVFMSFKVWSMRNIITTSVTKSTAEKSKNKVLNTKKPWAGVADSASIEAMTL